MTLPLIVIVGPTAVGKTALSLQIAQTYGGEIISADSRQIYRGLDIGTAKATPAEQALVPHYGVDVVNPDEVLTLAEFQGMVYRWVAEITARGHYPLLVGGSGQWVQAVVEGWGIPAVPPDMAWRQTMEQRDPATLHVELAQIDPEAAHKLDFRNVRRVVRALEVYYKTGRPITEHQRKTPPSFPVIQLGLTRPRELLYQRLDQRIDTMMAQGLLAEVMGLAAAGYDWQLPAMSGLGYRQIGQYLRGEVSLEEAVALIKKETRRFVRQQYNWFRLNDPQITWFELPRDENDIIPFIKTRLLP